ncbi:redox-sensing transcriptional repressor Rex [uncultured Porphyromonas sp.]|uniref:redox-sensing transcriptional repressor Rex n=1 Tax=uncultured Porphyromonas sp. TaxID=159274 RepID=UPI00262F1ECA|nr:redox-sensing transcriptional repressor Rex [uncultured Porphyromonas sp.]
MSRKKPKNQVPEPVLRRLPWYLAYIKLLQARGKEVVSSTYIARSIGIDPSLVAKDLSYVNIVGKTRVGYSTDEMVEVLGKFLGFVDQHRAYVFGCGNLGAALIRDKGLYQYGLDIVAGFDTSPEVIGDDSLGVPIYDMADLECNVRDDVRIGVLTVPVEFAQEVTDQLVAYGFRAIWNFTPFRISVPEGVVVENLSMYASLAVMFNRVSSMDHEES